MWKRTRLKNNRFHIPDFYIIFVTIELMVMTAGFTTWLETNVSKIDFNFRAPKNYLIPFFMCFVS